MIKEAEDNTIMIKSARRCCFGLYPIPNSKQPPGKPLPLQKVDIKAHIRASIAKIEFKQAYYNGTESLLEVEYFFPIPHNAC